MKFPKATEHVVEMAIIDVIHLLEMDFELIYGHIFRRILHDLEYLDHIVLPFLFLGVISMVMSIVEVYQLKSLVSWIHLQKFHLLLMATLDALRVQIGSIVSFETITMQLDSYSIFLAFLCQQIPQMYFIGDMLKHFSGLWEQELGAIIGFCDSRMVVGGSGATGLLAFLVGLRVFGSDHIDASIYQFRPYTIRYQNIQLMQSNSPPLLNVTIRFDQIEQLLNYAKNPQLMRQNFALILQPALPDGQQNVKELQVALQNLKISQDDNSNLDGKTEKGETQTVSEKKQEQKTQPISQKEQQKTQIISHPEKSEITQIQTMNLQQVEEKPEIQIISHKEQNQQKKDIEQNQQIQELQKLKEQVVSQNEQLIKPEEQISIQKAQLQRLRNIEALYLADKNKKAIQNIKVHVNEYRKDFKQTFHQYWGTDYFHVYPRKRLLNFVSKLIELTDVLEQAEPSALPIKSQKTA